MANKMSLNGCVEILESMRCANIIKIEETREAVRKARRVGNAVAKARADYLASTLPLRVRTARALGVAVDALRKGVAHA